jgi:hypothetical protein
MTNGETKTSTCLGVAAITLTILITAGCSTEPKRVEADFGNSTHQMIQASTYNPEAAASTESKPVLGMDGKRAMRTLDQMQTDTERPEDFNDIIDIELGSNSN